MVSRQFTPQPYTQLARVLSQMGHDREARRILIARERLLAKEARKDRAGDNVSLWRATLNGWDWFRDWAFYLIAGYGYRPFNSVFALVLLWLLSGLIADQVWATGAFAPNSDVILVSASWAEVTALDCIGPLPVPPPAGFTTCDPNPASTWSSIPKVGMDWDTFNAVAYGLDLVVPILDLGQTSAWAPSKDRGVWGAGLWWGRWVFEVLGWIVTALGAAAITGLIQRDRS